ncbi:FKBP-type peptidyl-prolyl cis-trans isomerase [Serratia marcescens]|nr:FKBP-type peptidyl-prolyl cis-trans isomerase [Serratia marcescens]
MLARQQNLLREQENRLTTLRLRLKDAEARLQSPSSRGASTPQGPTNASIDLTPLQQLLGGLRRAANGTPDEQHARALIKQAKQQTEQKKVALTASQTRVAALQTQLDDLNKQLRTDGQHRRREQQIRHDLQRRLETVQAALDEKSKKLDALQLAGKAQADTKREQEKILADLKIERDTLAVASKSQTDKLAQAERERAQLLTDRQTLQEKYDSLQQQHHTAKTQHAEQAQTLSRLETESAALHERAKWLIKPESLTRPETRQAYAAGSALGQDIITLLDERKAWGVIADRQTVLSGVIDAFSGQYQLAPDDLRAALTESENAVNKARQHARLTQQKKDEAFVANFKKQKGVKQSPSGFWYRVDYVGDTPIAKEAEVSIVVKESMTDGTVIQDMDLSGNMLTQPLSAYPPLFREAIGHLRNHGSLTMVVPPSLAYGEAGYPPNVPPNATMIYTLRIENTEAASDK